MLLGTVNENLRRLLQNKWFCCIFAGNSGVEVTLTMRTSNKTVLFEIQFRFLFFEIVVFFFFFSFFFFLFKINKLVLYKELSVYFA